MASIIKRQQQSAAAENGEMKYQKHGSAIIESNQQQK